MYVTVWKFKSTMAQFRGKCLKNIFFYQKLKKKRFSLKAKFGEGYKTFDSAEYYSYNVHIHLTTNCADRTHKFCLI